MMSQPPDDGVQASPGAANDHSDHDSIAMFRRRFLKEIEALFVRVLELAREMGLLKLGTVVMGEVDGLPAQRSGDVRLLPNNANPFAFLQGRHSMQLAARW